MSIRYVNCTASSPLVSRGLYRVTWAQHVALGLVAVGDVRDNLNRIYNGGLDGKGLGYAASLPAAEPGATAGTLDIRAPTLARGSVGEYAGNLQALAESGFNLDVARVELVPAGEGSADAAANRDRATADVTATVGTTTLGGKLETLGKRAVIVGAVLLVAYVFVTHKGGRSLW